MSELRELYQEIILDHYRHPRNFGPLPDENRHAEGYNPLCGDRVTVRLRLAGDRIAAIAFEGSGCAISTAAASLMAEAVEGRTVAEARDLFDRFHLLVTGDDDAAASVAEGLDKLAALGGVREFPVRVKCATLAWHTLKAALQGAEQPVSTE